MEASLRNSSLNTFELAGKIGYETFGEIGQRAYEELELAFASKLQPKTFKETSKMRSYINLNFYWGKSYFKNTLIEAFSECLPQGFNRRKITGGTTETIFGSMSQDGKRIISPLFWGYEMCFIPELTTFLSSKDFTEKSNNFNEVLEGQEVSRDLLKFGEATRDLIDEYSAGVDGLYFNGRTLKYIANTNFIVGTRPLNNRSFTYLEQSGFWSRFHTIQFRITDSTAADIFTGSYAPSVVNVEELKTLLKKANERLLTKRGENNNDLPDYDEVLHPVLVEALKYLKTQCEITKIDLSEVLNTRLKGDIAREAKAYQILCPEKSNEELKNWLIQRLPHFFDFVSKPLIAKDLTEAKTSRSDVCLAQIIQFTKNKERNWKEIMDEMQRQGNSTATVGRVLAFMKEKGIISTEKGRYKSQT